SRWSSEATHVFDHEPENAAEVVRGFFLDSRVLDRRRQNARRFDEEDLNEKAAKYDSTVIPINSGAGRIGDGCLQPNHEHLECDWPRRLSSRLYSRNRSQQPKRHVCRKPLRRI